MLKKLFFPPRALCIAIIFLTAFSSCTKKNGYEIELDNSDPIALATDINWAVVTVPYASFRKETSWDAQTTGYCKQGEYFPILATSTNSVEGNIEVWHRFEDGWLPDSTVAVYSNKLRAAKASEQLK